MISDLLNAIKSRLDAQEYFSDSTSTPPVPIPTLVEAKGEIDPMIQAAVDRLGISVLITVPDLDNLDPDKAKINAVFPIIVQVTETVLLNQADGGTKKHAIDVCEKVAEFLHFFQYGVFTRLKLIDIKRQESQTPLIYFVQFRAQKTISPVLQ